MPVSPTLANAINKTAPASGTRGRALSEIVALERGNDGPSIINSC